MNSGELLALVAVPAASLLSCLALAAKRARKRRCAAIDTQHNSFFERLSAHVVRCGSGPVDHEALRRGIPEWLDSDVPGLEDALHDFRAEGLEWLSVQSLIAEIRSGECGEWRVAEETLARIDIQTSLTSVLAQLNREDVTPSVSDVFWQVARSSNRPAAIKWGIAIGSIGLRPADLPDLLLFARHSEFTLYACNALLRESSRHPEYRFELIDLLGSTTGVGRIQVINAILGDEVLSASPRAQRAVLSNVIDDGQGVSPTLAIAIARRIDIDAWLPTASDDPSLARGLDRIVEQLLILHEELDELLGEERIIPFMRRLAALTAHRATTFESLSLLRLVRLVLSMKERDWEVPAELLKRTEELYRERLDPQLVERALQHEHYRWHALAIISEESMVDLLPAVHEDFKRSPNIIAIDILGRLGGRCELETLMRWLSSDLDLSARYALLTGGTDTAPAGEHAGGVAAYALQFMGRLSTPEALDMIRRALYDFDPALRGAALRALVDVESWRVDARMARAIELSLNDPFPRIRRAAASLLELLGDPREPDWQVFSASLN